MRTLAPELLSTVVGGMHLDDSIPPDWSSMEDRRHFTRAQTKHIHPHEVPTPDWDHHTGDLASQAGYDDIGNFTAQLHHRHTRRFRRWHRRRVA